MTWMLDDNDGEILQEMLELDVFGETARLKALSQHEVRRKEKGMILADEMGLGKKQLRLLAVQF